MQGKSHKIIKKKVRVIATVSEVYALLHVWHTDQSLFVVNALSWGVVVRSGDIGGIVENQFKLSGLNTMLTAFWTHLRFLSLMMALLTN